METQGYEFWTAFPRISNPSFVPFDENDGDSDANYCNISVASDYHSTIEISIPNLNWSEVHEVSPSAPLDLYLPYPLGSIMESGYGEKGVLIESDSLISVWATIMESSLGDTACLISRRQIEATKSEYILKNFTEAAYNRHVIVAMEDETTIEVTLSDETDVFEVGSTFEIVLNKGETYQILGPLPSNDVSQVNYTMTKILSKDVCKPISVMSFEKIPSSGGGSGSTFIQCTPIDLWGTDFHVCPPIIGDWDSSINGQTQTFECSGTYTVDILSISDNTSISVNGNTYLLNEGEQHRHYGNEPVFINSSNPCGVYCYSDCVANEIVVGVPNEDYCPLSGYGMYQVNNDSQYLYKRTFVPKMWPTIEVSNAIFYNLLCIIVRSEDIDTVVLNGDVVSSMEFIEFPNSSAFSYAYIRLPQLENEESYQLEASNGCLARVFSNPVAFNPYRSLSHSLGSDNINFQDFVLLNLGPNIESCFDEEIILEYELTGEVEYIWQDGSSTPSISPTETGLYSLLAVQEENGQCTHYQGSVYVEFVDCEELELNILELEMPNVFTPNDDSLNSYFKPIVHNNIATSNLKIFNRWGEIVFESKELEKGWDGTANGRNVSPGVYYWTVELIGTNKNDRIVKSGTVTLLRS